MFTVLFRPAYSNRPLLTTVIRFKYCNCLCFRFTIVSNKKQKIFINSLKIESYIIRYIDYNIGTYFYGIVTCDKIPRACWVRYPISVILFLPFYFDRSQLLEKLLRNSKNDSTCQSMHTSNTIFFFKNLPWLWWSEPSFLSKSCT